MIPENLPAVSELKQSKLQLQQYVLQATRKDSSKIQLFFSAHVRGCSNICPRSIFLLFNTVAEFLIFC
jgi:hypothetical protein